MATSRDKKMRLYPASLHSWDAFIESRKEGGGDVGNANDSGRDDVDVFSSN